MLSRNDIKTLARLHQKKYRRLEQKMLVEGARLTFEALQSDWTITRVLHTHAFRSTPQAEKIFELAKKRSIPTIETTQIEFKKISDTVNSQGVIAEVEMKNWGDNPLHCLRENHKCLMVAIEKLQDPGNLGTIMRTAEWLGADALILGPDTVSWSNMKALRASMGAVFHLPIFEVDDFVGTLELAKRYGATIYAADQRGDFPYTTLRYPAKKILLLGGEVKGISEQALALSDLNIVIPARGKGESLNVAIAAAILMAEMSR
ncbi:MAG TPA: RNA methyltransferase [Bacteroidetes bacterium]|nr:RNA methyltransferase [Bacteroidota bacterium]